MPALVIRELAQWLAERNGQVVAGASPPALDRAVEGVVRPRRFLPRDLDAIDVHEVVIASIDAFPPDADLSLEALVAALAEAQAGLIVAGLPPREAARHPAPYQAADALAFPLIAIPFATDLTNLANAIDAFQRERATHVARLVRDARAALTHARHDDPSLPGLLAACARQTGLTCIVEDEHRMLLTLAMPPGAPYGETQVHEALASLAARRAVRPATPDGLGEDIPVQRHLPGELARAIVPVMEGEATIAYLSLLGPDACVTTDAVEVLWRIAPDVLNEIRQARAQVAAPRRIAAAHLAAILGGTAATPDLVRLAEGHRITPHLSHAIVLARPAQADEQWAQAWAERLERSASGYWTTVWQHALAVVLSEAQITDGTLAALHRLLAENDSVPVALGVGRPASDITGWQRSAREAEQALNVALRRTEGGVQRYADLGVLRVILALQATDDAALDAFSHDTLAPLLRADTHHEDALLTTLEAYFAANGNLTGAARDLALHRNTLMYRLRRIEELLGASLDDPDVRLALHLALKIRQTRRD